MTDAVTSLSGERGDYARFRAEMLGLLRRVEVEVGHAVTRPLARLDLAAADDPTVALLDAFAVVADIVSFYEDRILNEGFLPSAVDYASLTRLARGIGEGPDPLVGASTALALFAQAGPPVVVPAGAAIQANAAPAGSSATAAAAPVFETAMTATADPALNQLTPLQTRPAVLTPAATSLLLQGTGLGLTVGGFLILGLADDTAQASPGALSQWVRLTIFKVTENSVLVTTEIEIGAALQKQWTAGGASAPLPLDARSGLRLYAADLTCRLFGYNAPFWSAQSQAAQRAATPPDQSPAQYTDWPGFAIDLNALDLQAVYAQVLPGSQFLLETPQDKKLGVIATVARDNLATFGMTGQATRVGLAPGVATEPSGNALVPARAGHTATALGDGRVLIVGGIGPWGVLDSVELFDPATGLVSQITALASPRALHSATIVGGVVYVAGGIGADYGFATDLLKFDQATLTFVTVNVPATVQVAPRIAHAAVALPDDTLMLSGGLSSGPGGAKSLALALAAMTATDQVAVYAPATNEWLWTAAMAKPRAGHSATVCPLVPQAGGPSAPAVGQVVVFLGGHDGAAIPPSGTPPSPPPEIWNTAELTDASAYKPLGVTYPIRSAGGVAGSERFDHVATPMPGNNGFLVTGGQASGGPVADNWLVGVVAPAGGSPPIPVFTPAPPLGVARADHAASLLSGGKIVVAGGRAGSVVLAATETYQVDPAASIPFGGAALSPSVPGQALPGPQAYAGYAALSAGALLLTGGLGALALPSGAPGYLNAVVIYDPEIGTVVSYPGPVLSTPYTYAPAGTVALSDGTILVLGVSTPGNFPLPPAAMTAFAWTFDPATKLATTTGAPMTPRLGATLTRLGNGSVLLAGGIGLTKAGYGTLDTAEIYDPKNRVFRTLGSPLGVARYGHSATLLNDGTVLLAGGFYFPVIAYDPPGVIATAVPALASAELFNNGTQAFTPIASALPMGFALHAATLLGDGNVLISGGITSFYIQRDFTAFSIDPLAQAAVYNGSAQGFALIAPMPAARALHSATLLDNGQVLLAGGVSDAAMTATDTTLLFDPRTSSFAGTVKLAVPRRSHGAMLVPDGVLLIGGVGAQSTEIAVPGAKAPGASYALPLPMPSPAWPPLVSLVQRVEPILCAGAGVFAFGGTVAADGTCSSTVIQYVEAPPAPGTDARRQALVYTQSRTLTLAPPIDNAPLGLPATESAATSGPPPDLVLAGLIDGIAIGQSLVVAGQPPLARAIGDLPGLDGGTGVGAGTVVMALAARPAATGGAWVCEVADIGRLTLVTQPGAHPPTGLAFLSGNGSTIGNVTAADLRLYDRPVRSETVTVRGVQQDAGTQTTALNLGQPLANLYDRTTTSVYGNIVTVTQGSTVAGEVVGSGDGQVAFQSFMLKQAPLTWLEEPDGTIAPQLTVQVAGSAWTRVSALVEAGPEARAYQITQDAQGRTQLQFGDGVNGLRLPTGANNVTATYRIGAGFDGNVAAGALTRAPAQVAGIKSVLNPVAATGGIGAPARGTLRARIPNGVADLGRIVTQADMLSFVRNRPEVGTATLSTVLTTHGEVVSLITLAGPANGVPDMGLPTFTSLAAAFQAALASPLAYALLAYEPTAFKLVANWILAPNQDEQAVKLAMQQALGTRYAPSALGFGEAVRLDEVQALLAAVPGVAKIEIASLWVPVRQPQGQNAILPAFPAAWAAPPAVPTGAQILALSTDADAATFNLKPQAAGA